MRLSLLLRSTFLKALFLSFALHFLIAKLFIFTFTLRPSSHKPQIIFWGSFLKKADIFPYAVQQKPALQDRSVQSFIHAPVPIRAATPFRGKSILKPAQLDPGSQAAKIVIKSIFPVTLDKEGPRETSATIIKIPSDIGTYKPLKLYPE